MTGRRKGTPCACETDPCSCGSSKGKCVRAVNNVSPDPNGDLVIRGGKGIEVIQSGDDLVINNTANPNAFVAGNNIELNPSGDDISINLADEPIVNGLTVNGDTQLNGDLEVNGDIIQNGAAYETHAEKVYTRDDYIIMREGAVAALPQGDYSGFQVKLYDGVNDGRLVIDSSGTARVGDVGDEEPLLTRDESANLTNGHLLEWDATNFKAVDSGTDVSAINTAISGKVSGTGNIGSDTKPIKIVNGAAVAVTNELQTKLTPTVIKSQYGITVQRYGQLIVVTAESYNHGTPAVHTVFTDMPRAIRFSNGILMRNRQIAGEMYVNTNTRNLVVDEYISGGAFGCLTYLTDE